MGAVKNILVGVGRLYISNPLDPDTLVPTASTGTDPAGWGNSSPTSGTYPNFTYNWRDIGFTMEGVEVTLEPDMVDITVDQLGDAAKIVEQSTKIMVKTTLAESTLTNLALAWGFGTATTTNPAGRTTDQAVISDANVAEQLNLGVFATGVPIERSVFFVGRGPGGVSRTYKVNRVISVASSGHGYKRGEATVHPVELRVLPNSNFTGIEYGQIKDYVGTFTN
jgi:hypothetical protein